VGVLPTDGNFHAKLVMNEVQCELQDFIHDNPYALDPDKAGTVSIVFQTDVTGNVTYLGIDLSKTALQPLAQLVALQNKAPSLQAKAQEKSTSIWQIDFGISQNDGRPERPGKTPPRKLAFAVPSKSDCDNPAKRYLPGFRLHIDEWLTKLFRNLDDPPTQEGQPIPIHNSDIAFACLKTITMKTTFQIFVDVSGGAATPIVGAAIIPISGLNFDYNPSFTHTLSLALATKSDAKGKTPCNIASDSKGPPFAAPNFVPLSETR
jgi:hypothetical protein